MKNITLTLTQVNRIDANVTEYQHTINVKLNTEVSVTFGQLIGQLNFKFFKSVMAMRHSGNKGFSFNNLFHFQIDADGHTLCNTLTLDETLKAKVRMANTIDGQKRFARLMAGMLYSAFGDDFHYSAFGDYEDTTYIGSDHAQSIRMFMDTEVCDIID
jgi:hypothetical protein